MSDKFISTWFYASLDTYKKDTGFIRTKMEEFHTQRSVNLDEYSALLAEKYNEMDSLGYDVVNVLPISMGQSDHCTQANGTYVGDVGFSITRGAVVIGKKRGG
ncbi:hypothetical protein [Aeromonas hydrophila]|uniref:hypothetical protein n=1 Tax=Aeromonas hydrophila TaxID=644 RepID=UPI0014550590|nr:hypothetical protein [Aeromonas hydrophila]NLR37330.1 hypothetical protein [Aeromonas hydrophila]